MEEICLVPGNPSSRRYRRRSPPRPSYPRFLSATTAEVKIRLERNPLPNINPRSRPPKSPSPLTHLTSQTLDIPYLLVGRLTTHTSLIHISHISHISHDRRIVKPLLLYRFLLPLPPPALSFNLILPTQSSLRFREWHIFLTRFSALAS